MRYLQWKRMYNTSLGSVYWIGIFTQTNDQYDLLHSFSAPKICFQTPDGGLKNEPPLSFYAVYDGHAGKDAAAFAASNLHGKILDSQYYPSDPVLSIKDAFNRTDDIFLEKGQKEVSNTILQSIICNTVTNSLPKANLLHYNVQTSIVSPSHILIFCNDIVDCK